MSSHRRLIVVITPRTPPRRTGLVPLSSRHDPPSLVPSPSFGRFRSALCEPVFYVESSRHAAISYSAADPSGQGRGLSPDGGLRQATGLVREGLQGGFWRRTRPVTAHRQDNLHPDRRRGRQV